MADQSKHKRWEAWAWLLGMKLKTHDHSLNTDFAQEWSVVFCVDKEYEMSNAEFGAYQDMLRGCEESLFSQQVGDDDEIIEDEQE